VSNSSVETRVYRGGCHCGRVAFEVTSAPPTRAEVCNCSICTKKGYLHWTVEPEAFRLLTPTDQLATYTFNTGTAQHHFCPRCGVASFYIPRSDPDKIDINLRCVEDIDPSSLEIEFFDGQHWEASFAREKANRSQQEK